MKSIRLAQYSREEILNSVMREFTKTYFAKAAYKTEVELRNLIQEEYHRVMTNLWIDCYGHIDLSKIPNWMLQVYSFSVSVAGSSRVESCELAKRPGKWGAIDLIIDDEEIFEEYDKLRAELSAYNKEFKSYRSEVKAVLDSVTTTKQLVELWPTVEQYIPAHLADPEKGVKLPALHISRLDERLRGGV